MFPTSMDEWVILEAFGRVPARRCGGVAPLRHEVALAAYLEKNRTQEQAQSAAAWGHGVSILRQLRTILDRASDVASKVRFRGHGAAAVTPPYQR